MATSGTSYFISESMLPFLSKRLRSVSLKCLNGLSYEVLGLYLNVQMSVYSQGC